jgi:signal transduction histidine kinase
MNKYIAAKIGLWLSIVFIMVALFGWDLLKDMDRLQFEANIIEKSNNQSHELHSIELGVNACIKPVKEFLITGDYRLAKRFSQRHSSLLTSIRSYEKQYRDNALDKLAQSLDQIKSKAHDIFNLSFAVGNMEGPIILQEIIKETEQAIDQLSTKHHELDIQVNDAMRMVDGLRIDMRTETLVILVILLLTLLLLSHFIYSQIVIPLVRMKTAVQQVGAGELTVQCNVSSQDEIGELGAAFNAMGNALQERDRMLNRARSLAAYQEKMNALGLMSAGIAHEVGNPLAAISVSLQVAQRKLNSKDFNSANRQIQTALKEAERMESIIQMLLSFGRQESDNGTKFFDLKPVIDDAIKLAQMSPGKKSVKITNALPSDIPKIYGVEGMLLQVLINLILNAINACKKDGEIDICVFEDSNGVAIDVRDTGHGIPQELREEIFKPSFTTKPIGEGTGLGLAISRELINGMGGSLQFIDSDLKGSCFRIWLPVKEVV